MKTTSWTGWIIVAAFTALAPFAPAQENREAAEREHHEPNLDAREREAAEREHPE